MVCGDDDQGIFGFAKPPTAILGFAKRCGAVVTISDNFRCFAEHTILATTHQRNKVRAQAALPVRGFGRRSSPLTIADEMGTRIAENIRNAIDQG